MFDLTCAGASFTGSAMLSCAAIIVRGGVKKDTSRDRFVVRH
jgi:hypothetical protein